MVLGFWEASSGIHSDGGSDDSDGEFASAESGEESREDESGGEEEEQISQSVSSGSDIDPAERASARPSDVGRLTRTWAVSH